MLEIIKNILRNKIFNRIASQFILSYIVFATIAIASVGFFLLNETEEFIRLSTQEKQLEIAKRSASQITYFVENTFNSLTFATEIQDVYLMQPFNQEKILDMLKINNDFYRKLYITDSTQAVTATTDFAAQDTILQNPPVELDRNRLSRNIVPVEIIENRPVITVSIPILQYENFVGTLAAEVDVSFIWDLVDSLSAQLTGGQVYIVSSRGEIIAHPNRRLVYSNENLSSFPFVQNLLDGQNGTDFYNDPFIENTRLICAYIPVPELYWGVVVAQDEAVALAVSREILTRLIFIIIGSIILASVLGIVITRNLVQPLKSLVEGAQNVSKGALHSRITIPRTDELATLAKEFNIMTENLEKTQSKLQMAEQLATVSKFASVIAHEIRNPFNSIVINIQVLKRGMEKKENKERLEQYLEIIDSEIKRIDDLIENYLNISRPQEFKPESIDIDVLLDELILANHAKAVKQHIKVERKSELESPNIVGDQDKLKQAFLNIILNSFQAMLDGGKLKISVTDTQHNWRKQTYVKVIFEDSGVGIDSSNMPNVFDYFYTSKTKGTGLGLPVTKQIIEMHYGSIDIISTPSHGTTVIINLPKEIETNDERIDS